MKPEKYRKRFQPRSSNTRERRQLATEAARRLIASMGYERALESTDQQVYYAAKRKAAAVLGHTIRPGDLPSDAEVREQLISLNRGGLDSPASAGPDPADGDLVQIADHIDRFEIYRMRLEPLENVKQNPRTHPEGDALYHSLQVFEQARAIRPYDEEFLLAALLHDIGKAISTQDHIRAALVALKDTITQRTAWLIQHHHDLSESPARTTSPRDKRALEESEFYEDLQLLCQADADGTQPGVPVCSLAEALDYLKRLELEFDLEDPADTP